MWMFTSNGTVWYPFCPLWQSIACFRGEKVSCKWPICDMRIGYGPHKCDMWYANRLRAMSNCKVAFWATILICCAIVIPHKHNSCWSMHSSIYSNCCCSNCVSRWHIHCALLHQSHDCQNTASSMSGFCCGQKRNHLMVCIYLAEVCWHDIGIGINISAIIRYYCIKHLATVLLADVLSLSTIGVGSLLQESTGELCSFFCWYRHKMSILS